MKKYYASNLNAAEQKYTCFDSTPTSFILESGVEEEEYFGLVTRYQDLSQHIYTKEHLPAKHCSQNVWLVKPANLNQGKGIEIFRNLRDIKKFIWGKPPKSQWVIQKYIEKPLLYNERKFDIRVWVLVTDKYDIFFYRQGYIRTSSDKYTLDSTENYVHLTNNCLQQFGENYGLHEEGNTLSFEALDNLLLEKGKSGILEFSIIPRMKDLIIDTILAAKQNDSGLLNNKHKTNKLLNFELLGYDFMIDEDLRIWLIEVNTNPYLGIPNPFIEKLLPKMLDDLFDLVFSNQYVRANFRENETKNEFELLYAEKGSSYTNNEINLRRSFDKKLLYSPNNNEIKISHSAKYPKWKNKKNNKSIIHKSQADLCQSFENSRSNIIVSLNHEVPDAKFSTPMKIRKAHVKVINLIQKASLADLTKQILSKSPISKFTPFFNKLAESIKKSMTNDSDINKNELELQIINVFFLLHYIKRQ